MPTLPHNSGTRSISATNEHLHAAVAAAALVRVYQLLVRPLLPPACRFAPTCSEYARQAILAHGVRRGVLLALRRLGRCHARHPGGWDPVPGAQET